MLNLLITTFLAISLAPSSASIKSKARVYDPNGRVEINRDYWRRFPEFPGIGRRLGTREEDAKEREEREFRDAIPMDQDTNYVQYLPETNQDGSEITCFCSKCCPNEF